MQNRYIKFLLFVAIVAFIVPQITLASWYNPFSWNWNVFSWFSRPQVVTPFVPTPTSKNQNNNQQQDTQTQIDQTASWKTYTNSDLGFSLKYPLNFDLAKESAFDSYFVQKDRNGVLIVRNFNNLEEELSKLNL